MVSLSVSGFCVGKEGFSPAEAGDIKRNAERMAKLSLRTAMMNWYSVRLVYLHPSSTNGASDSTRESSSSEPPSLAQRLRFEAREPRGIAVSNPEKTPVYHFLPLCYLLQRGSAIRGPTVRGQISLLRDAVQALFLPFLVRTSSPYSSHYSDVREVDLSRSLEAKDTDLAMIDQVRKV
jgi:hypothetical protein